MGFLINFLSLREEKILRNDDIRSVKKEERQQIFRIPIFR
jgi:hypothetical protein